MGGHGGLNILPQARAPSTTNSIVHDDVHVQKSWHVYGRENRNRVARDEAKHAEEQKVLDEKREQAEREHRRNHLLARARARYGVRRPLYKTRSTQPPIQQTDQQSTQASEDTPTAPIDAPPTHIEPAAPNAVAAPRDRSPIRASGSPRAQLHINFFRKEELKQKHEEEEVVGVDMHRAWHDFLPGRTTNCHCEKGQPRNAHV